MTAAPEQARPEPQIVHEDDRVTLWNGDCLDVLEMLPDASVDAVVTDPPYGLEFMGRSWDAPWKNSGAVLERATDRGGFQDGNGGNPCSRSRIEYGRGGQASVGFQEWCTMWAADCLRVLKPGGHILAFGGSRTWHRLAAAIEDAGFEIRDSIAWMYGSGFPKSLNVAKAIDKHLGADRPVVKKRTIRQGGGTSLEMSAGPVRFVNADITANASDEAKTWDGWGTALKPAFEPIVVGRKPLEGTVATTVLRHGTGGINIDGTRVGSDDDTSRRPSPVRGTAAPFGTGGAMGGEGSALGRWPSNVLLTHTPLLDTEGNVVGDACAQGCREGCPVRELDTQSGPSASGGAFKRWDTRPATGGDGGYGFGAGELIPGYADAGTASRFFPTFRYSSKADQGERPRLRKSRDTEDETAHPTVKPLELMRWLVRLVTPAGGTVLEPFAGSGTTAEACLVENVRCVAVERERDYVPLIVHRITRRTDPVAHLAAQADRGEDVDLGLFALLDGDQR